MGEMARSLTMFQSFSMTMIATHMHALAIKDGVAGNRAMNNALFYAMHTVLAGAAIVQARQMLQGKDPIDMHNGKFWWQSATQGGGLGFYGDLIGGVTQAADRTVIGKFSGPVGGFVDDPRCSARPGGAAKAWRRRSGRASILKHIVPGSNLWFSRLATDRLIFDQLQRLADPTGAVAPERAPSVSSLFGP
jgi:hypothetical protein